MQRYGAGFAFTVALHTALGLLTGNLAGALGGGLSQAAIPTLSAVVDTLGLPLPVAQAFKQLGSAAIGAAVGGTAGATTALTETAQNYLGHPELKTRALNSKACSNGDAQSCKTVRDLDQLSAERNAVVRDGAMAVSVEQGNQVLANMQTTMVGLQGYKSELAEKLEKTSNPQERADLQGQLNQADNNIRQVATLGKDYQYALFEKTNDPKYLTAYVRLNIATSGNELVDAFMSGMVATGAGTRKSPIADVTPQNRPASVNAVPPPTASKNPDGFTELRIPATPTEAQARLNTADVTGTGKLNPAEAAAAAQTEGIFGPMKRNEIPATPGANTPAGNPDFIVTSGPNAGKTVDFMYTTNNLSTKEIEGLNRFYAKNMESGRGTEQIQSHLNKADIVPVDFRVLTPTNQQIFMDYVKTLPASQQAKIVILR